jgi:hypothetical protein
VLHVLIMQGNEVLYFVINKIEKIDTNKIKIINKKIDKYEHEMIRGRLKKKEMIFTKEILKIKNT